MTIGIAVSGPLAGLAAFRALRAVETVGRGAINGFVSFVAIDESGELFCADTQHGGGDSLFDGTMPERFAECRLAALMASGPDRPEPLIQFTPGDPRAGLVTGHRLPNMPGPDGVPPNRIALARLASGATPEEAVAAGLADNPEADAGLIAMNLDGRIALANSAAVKRRDDLGEALVHDAASGLRIGVLHNSIFPSTPLAALAVSAAIDAVSPLDRVDADAMLVGTTLAPGPKRCLLLDRSGAVLGVIVNGQQWFDGDWEGSPVQRGDPVLQEDRVIGRVTREVYGIVRDGRVVGGRGGERVGWRLTGPDEER